MTTILFQVSTGIDRNVKAACMLLAVLLFFGCEAPRIVINSDMYNFGIVKPEKQLSHIINIKNTGNATLIIKKIDSG